MTMTALYTTANAWKSRLRWRTLIKLVAVDGSILVMRAVGFDTPNLTTPVAEGQLDLLVKGQLLAKTGHQHVRRIKISHL